jgi:hypothetical protein
MNYGPKPFLTYETAEDNVAVFTGGSGPKESLGYWTRI